MTPVNSPVGLEAAAIAEIVPVRSPPYTMNYWLARQLAEPDFLMGELFSTTTRAMIVGPTGLGKTKLGLALALSMAAGRDFCHWRARRPARVLYIDGEMSRRQIQRRLRDLEAEIGAVSTDLLVLSSEDVKDGLPPLNTPAGQRYVEHILEDRKPIHFLIADNVQALVSGDMKEEEPWAAVLPWVRKLTRMSIGQMWFHHTGHDETKSYGSKAREWQMDTVALMQRLKKEEAGGADIAFRLNFTKARERRPENRADFANVVLTLTGDRWDYRLEDAEAAKRLPTGAAKVAYDLLKEAVAEVGEPAPASNHIPPKSRTTTLVRWREYCDRGLVSDSTKPDSQRKAFVRACNTLQAGGFIGVWNEQVWVV